MTVFDGSLVLTHYGLCPCENLEHKHVVGIQFVGTLSILERFGIAIHLASQHGAVSSQRVTKRVRTVQVDRTRGCQCCFPKRILRINSVLLECRPAASKRNCMQGQHTPRIDSQRVSRFANSLIEEQAIRVSTSLPRMRPGHNSKFVGTEIVGTASSRLRLLRCFDLWCDRSHDGSRQLLLYCEDVFKHRVIAFSPDVVAG